MVGASNKRTFLTSNYDLSGTLTSGQAFRWLFQEESWVGIVGRHWVRLRGDAYSIAAETAEPVSDWGWLEHYLQLTVDLDSIVRTFPDDAPMRHAVESCRGLRLLRQDPWECLASFILSSTKQIVQIQQIIGLLCERFGDALPAGPGSFAFSFPSAAQLAKRSESELRACKMGFRAPYLLETARRIANAELDLSRLYQMPTESARSELLSLPGVGRKIADCVLLFAYGFQDAFPIDVWVTKALRQLYYPNKRTTAKRLHRFAATHFGPNAGYAQQYLFHHMRTKHPKPVKSERIKK
jgi:N-glycosylase/DNA lyase